MENMRLASLALVCLVGLTLVSMVTGERSVLDNVVNTVDQDGFVCMTFDWWGRNKSGWDDAGLLNLDFQDKQLASLFKRAAPKYVRIGGTLADSIVYLPELDNRAGDCTEGVNCLNETRLLQILDFVCNVGQSKLVFSINEMFGRHSSAANDWDYSNAEFLLKYLHQSSFSNCFHGFQLGNELNKVLTADQVATDYAILQGMLHQIWSSTGEEVPLIIGPDPHSWVEFESKAMIWYEDVLSKTKDSLNVTGYHMYAMGSGSDSGLDNRFVNQSYIRGRVSSGADRVVKAVKSKNPNLKIWASETSSANNSGKDKLTNTFLNSFWYVTELGLMALRAPHQAVCRQAFIGGFYELVDKSSVTPNSDYFMAVIWKQIMGGYVLDLNVTVDPDMEIFTHCAQPTSTLSSCGLGVAIINNSPTPKGVSVSSFELDGVSQRDEYHFTVDLSGEAVASVSALETREVLLNGESMLAQQNQGYPFIPKVVTSPLDDIQVDGYSITFIRF